MAFGFPYRVSGKVTHSILHKMICIHSWHHDFMVKILPGGVIQAESKSAYQEMFFDLGRNKRNVQKFFTQIEQLSRRDSR